ncbi:unnamed protein product, partial [Allacma fusca]
TINLKLSRPDLQLVTGLNTFFTNGKGLNFPANIVATFVLPGGFTISDTTAREVFQDRLLNLEKPNGELIYGKFKMYWTNFLGYACWKEDRDFKLSRHIRNYDYPGQMSLPSAPSQAILESKLSLLLRTKWIRTQSPWEVLLIQNYRGSGQTVFIFRIDHALGDGRSFLGILRNVTGAELKFPSFKISVALKKSDLFFKSLEIPFYSYLHLLEYGDRKRLPAGPGPLGLDYGGTTISISPEIPVEVIKRIKKHFNVSYACVLYAAISGAISRALEGSDQNVPNDFSAGLVLPKPNPSSSSSTDSSDDLSLEAYFAETTLPLKASTGAERLLQIEKSLQLLRKSCIPMAFDLIFKMHALLPLAWMSRRMPKTPSVSISIVPVTTSRDSYQGFEISEMSSFISNMLDYDISIVTYGLNNKQRLSFCPMRWAQLVTNCKTSEGKKFPEKAVLRVVHCKCDEYSVAIIGRLPNQLWLFPVIFYKLFLGKNLTR